MLGPVLAEIEPRILEDVDQVSEPLYSILALAELVWVVEIRKVGAGQAEGVGVDERLNDLGVDPVTDVTVPLRITMSVNAAPLGIVTGGSKPSKSAYLSETYLMNSMKRT